MTYFQLFQSSLKETGSKLTQEEIKNLLLWTFSLSEEDFWKKKSEEISKTSLIKEFQSHLDLLLHQKPLAYITNHSYFYSYKFIVNPQVLIPRPETEILIEKIIDIIHQPKDIIDLGTGCGNIAITLSKETASKVMAVEKSPEAFNVLKENIRYHNIQDLVYPHLGDLLSDINEKFDIVVSNPPYIKSSDMKKLPLSVKDYEPKIALFGGKTGLTIIKKIINDSYNILKPQGFIFLEIGYDQYLTVEQLLQKKNYSDITFFKDFKGIKRVVRAQR